MGRWKDGWTDGWTEIDRRKDGKMNGWINTALSGRETAVGSRALPGRAAGAARVETVRPEQDLDTRGGHAEVGGTFQAQGAAGGEAPARESPGGWGAAREARWPR